MLSLPTYLGQVGDTGVFRVSLGSLGLTSLGSLQLLDSGQLSAGARNAGPGAASGFDLDFLRISNVLTNDPAVAAGLVATVPLQFNSSTVTFHGGFLEPVPPGTGGIVNSPTLLGALPGNRGIDFPLATLDIRDGLSANSSGSVSLGVGGAFSVALSVPVDPNGLSPLLA